MSFNPVSFLPDDFLPDNFLPEGAATVPTFIGPDIASFGLVLGLVMSARDYSSRFDAANPLTFSVVGTLPTGLSLSAAGVLTGTPTALGTTSGLIIRASDGINPDADSNAFSIIVQNPGPVQRHSLGFRLGFGL